jgi:hypothetical protein
MNAVPDHDVILEYTVLLGFDSDSLSEDCWVWWLT